MLKRTSRANARILITGANGQIGTDLVRALRQQHGATNVIASDIRKPSAQAYTEGPFEYCDVIDRKGFEKLIVDHNIDTLIHNSAIMSVLGEAQPHKCMELNIDGTRNALELARIHNLKVFSPSTMAVFSGISGKVKTQDDCILQPTTIYGVTKVFLEQLGEYYRKKFNIDFRSVRLGGIISSDAPPGGGTTDYAVWMYHYAIDGKTYECPVLPDEPLPMMYMPDCLSVIQACLDAPKDKLTRSVYNTAAISFTPTDVANSIRKIYPDFKVEYKRGVAQDIANSWPDSMDDTNARRDFNWAHKWDLDAMTKDMLEKIRIQKKGK